MPQAVYETDELVGQYLSLHFPSSGESEGIERIMAHEGAPLHAMRFPQRVARLLVEAIPDRSARRVLDVGCAVGGSSFELASAGFEEVVGLDLSKAFIDAAKRMQQGDEVSFSIKLEGNLQKRVVAVHESPITAAIRERIEFQVGDACQLLQHDPPLGTFDGVVAANLLCRLPRPLAFLDALPTLVKRNGVVVMITPFSWLEDFTAEEHWIGGKYDAGSGQAVGSKEALKEEMSSRGFAFMEEHPMPLVIREHARKYQYIISHAMLWRRADGLRPAKKARMS
mmetsp:Transcript_21397/g.49798  ORF Transcript_21397/g.49798 Transcript_21397/m.49798 type:complete len:282 (-) Transcript_21397:3-848(-)